MTATIDADPPATGRRSGRLVAIVVAALISLAVLVWLAFSVVQVLAHETRRETFAIDGTVRHMVIDLDDGSVTLHGVDVESVTGTRRIEKGLHSPHFRETLVGDTLRITSGCSSWFSTWCEVSYDLYVPRGVTVDAHSSGGSVKASGLTGDLTLKSSAGGVSVDGSSGRLRLHSSAGSVKVTNASSRDIQASSSAGSVLLAFLVPPSSVTATSSAGSVRVALPNGPTLYRVDANSSAGGTDVAVNTSPTATRTIRAQSSAGSVHVVYGTATKTITAALR